MYRDDAIRIRSAKINLPSMSDSQALSSKTIWEHLSWVSKQANSNVDQMEARKAANKRKEKAQIRCPQLGANTPSFDVIKLSNEPTRWKKKRETCEKNLKRSFVTRQDGSNSKEVLVYINLSTSSKLTSCNGRKSLLRQRGDVASCSSRLKDS